MSRSLDDRHSHAFDASLSAGPGGRPLITAIRQSDRAEVAKQAVTVTDITTNSICEIEVAPHNQITSKLHAMYQGISLVFITTVGRVNYTH